MVNELSRLTNAVPIRIQIRFPLVRSVTVKTAFQAGRSFEDLFGSTSLDKELCEGSLFVFGDE